MRWGIMGGTRKLDAISAILRRVAIVHRSRSKIEQLKEDLVRKRFDSVAQIHVFYKEHFNWVDLVDRRWGSVEEHHHHRSWKTKYALMLMRIGIINSWTFHKMQVGIDWLPWRNQLAMEMKETRFFN